MSFTNFLESRIDIFLKMYTKTFLLQRNEPNQNTGVKKKINK